LLDPNRSKYELNDLARDAAEVEKSEKPANGWTSVQWETAAAADLTAQTARVLHQRILEKKLETIYSEMELRWRRSCFAWNKRLEGGPRNTI